MSNSRVLIFNQFGSNPREVDARIEYMEWNDTHVTDARLSMALTDSKLKQRLLKKGNMILIETADIQKWAGVIMTPTSWRSDRVEFTAKSHLYYLARQVPTGTFNLDMTAGALALRMIWSARVRAGFSPFITREQRVDTGGQAAVGKVRRFYTVLDNLRHLARKNGFEFWLNPRITGGELKFHLNWQQRKQKRGGSIEIGENGNAAWGNPAVVESGDLITAWHVEETEMGGKGNRRVFLVADKAAAKFGHWEGVATVKRIDSGKERTPEFQRTVQEHGRPEKRYRIQVQIGAGNKYKLSREIEPGSIHWLYGPDMDFTKGRQGTIKRVRVTDMAYKENDPFLDVVAKEWTGALYENWIP